MIPTPAAVAASVTRHIAEFIERPHPAFGGQPVCPFARRARLTGRLSLDVAAFGPDDISEVRAAVARFAGRPHEDVLLVVHPDPAGLPFAALDALRESFAAEYAGTYAVFTGHPDDPHTLAGVRTRTEPHPMLHFVRTPALAAAEASIARTKRVLSRTG